MNLEYCKTVYKKRITHKSACRIELTNFLILLLPIIRHALYYSGSSGDFIVCLIVRV
ncbi:hypothetical protein Hanom_Chr09g00831791 [Helianthus anomalus]